jgi:hypothetical protein
MRQYLTFFCILLRSGGTSLNTHGNARFDVFHIRFRIPRKPQHKCGTILPLYCFPCSLIALQNNKWLHIPCLTGCSGPSFLHHLPAYTKQRNGYK